MSQPAFIGYGWNVTRVGDANDLDMLDRALLTHLRKTTDRPTLIIVDSHIAWGFAKISKTHMLRTVSRWVKKRIKLTKRAYGWPEDAKFLVPDGVYDHFQAGMGKTRTRSSSGVDGKLLKHIKAKYPDLGDALLKMQRRQLPDGWDKRYPRLPCRSKGCSRS